MSTFESIAVAGIVWLSFVGWTLVRTVEKIEESLASIKKDIEEIRDAQDQQWGHGRQGEV